MSTNVKHIRFGDYTLDRNAGVLRKKGRPVSLNPQSIQLLEMLIVHRGRIVTREEIRRELWGEDTYVAFDTGINSCVRRLRDALGDDASIPRFIKTAPREGYRFVGAVREMTPLRTRILKVLPKRWRQKTTDDAVVEAGMTHSEF